MPPTDKEDEELDDPLPDENTMVDHFANSARCPARNDCAAASYGCVSGDEEGSGDPALQAIANP